MQSIVRAFQNQLDRVAYFYVYLLIYMVAVTSVFAADSPSNHSSQQIYWQVIYLSSTFLGLPLLLWGAVIVCRNWLCLETEVNMVSGFLVKSLLTLSALLAHLLSIWAGSLLRASGESSLWCQMIRQWLQDAQSCPLLLLLVFSFYICYIVIVVDLLDPIGILKSLDCYPVQIETADNFAEL